MERKDKETNGAHTFQEDEEAEEIEESLRYSEEEPIETEPDLELTAEEIEEEAFRQLVLEAQQEALAEEAYQKQHPQPKKRRVPRLVLWLMAFVLLFQPIAFIFDIYSLPAIEFLKTSSKLSKQANIAEWKQSVAVVLTEDGKGTGFLVSEDGLVVTNNHVIENTSQITVSFDENGRFPASVVAQDSVNDLAVLKMKDTPKVPALKIADNPSYTADSHVQFIGNPLNFFGIANEGSIIGETSWAGRTEPIILLNAPVYRGNSGSPVFQNEKVIGVVFAVTELEKFGKVGMFIRSEEVLNLLNTVD